MENTVIIKKNARKNKEEEEEDKKDRDKEEEEEGRNDKEKICEKIKDVEGKEGKQTRGDVHANASPRCLFVCLIVVIASAMVLSF